MITNQFTRKLVTTFATLVSRKLLVGPLFVHLEDFVSSVFFFFSSGGGGAVIDGLTFRSSFWWPLAHFAIFKSFSSNQLEKGSISFESVDLKKGNGRKKENKYTLHRGSSVSFCFPRPAHLSICKSVVSCFPNKCEFPGLLHKVRLLLS